MLVSTPVVARQPCTSAPTGPTCTSEEEGQGQQYSPLSSLVFSVDYREGIADAILSVLGETEKTASSCCSSGGCSCGTDLTSVVQCFHKVVERYFRGAILTYTSKLSAHFQSGDLSKEHPEVMKIVEALKKNEIFRILQKLTVQEAADNDSISTEKSKSTCKSRSCCIANEQDLLKRREPAETILFYALVLLARQEQTENVKAICSALALIPTESLDPAIYRESAFVAQQMEAVLKEKRVE